MELNLIDCQPLREDAKVAKIQNELRIFDYDISAWQLDHPEKMLISRPELFTNPDSKDKWLTALHNKIKESKETLEQIIQSEPDKIKKITRLESKIQELTQAKAQISQQTQTDLTMEQIKQWEQADKNKTLYQKFVEKYGRK